MGIENIATGYKPEFALGALYHGFNAGSADNASQLSNLIQEQALQKSRIGDPLDLIQKFYDAQLANAKSQSPDYIPAQLRGQIGQMNSQEAAGTLAQGLLPFKQRAGEAELTTEATKNRLFGNMYQGIEQQHDQSLDPNMREAAGQKGFFLADTLSRVDPKVMAQERMLGTKLDSAEDIAGMRIAAQQKLVSLKTPAIRGDKTAQEAIVKHLQGMLSRGEITAAEYASELAELQNAILAAKVQPGMELNPANPALKDVLQPKPTQQGYTAPGVGGQQPQQSQNKLTPEQRAEIIKNLTGQK